MKLAGNIESQTNRRDEYSYSVEAERLTAGTAHCSVYLKVKMSGSGYYRYRIKSSVSVNGVVQEHWVKDGLGEWRSSDWIGPFTVFDGVVNVKADDTSLNIVPTLWHPESGGGLSDCTNWAGMKGVWHPFVNEEENQGDWADRANTKDGAWLNNRSYSVLEAGRLIDAYMGIESVDYVHTQFIEWDGMMLSSFRNKIWWEPAKYAEGYKVFYSVNGAKPVYLASTEDIKYTVRANDIPDNLMPGDVLSFGVQTTSTFGVSGDTVWSDALLIVSEEEPLPFASGVGVSPVKIDPTAGDDMLHVRFSFDGATIHWEQRTNDGGKRVYEIVMVATWDVAGVGSSQTQFGAIHDGSNEFHVKLSDIMRTLNIDEIYDSNDITVRLREIERVTVIDKYQNIIETTDRDVWDFGVIGKINVLSYASYGPDFCRIVSSVNAGRINDLFVDGEKATVEYSGAYSGTVPISRYRLVLYKREDLLESIEHEWEWSPNEALNGAGGKKFFVIDIPQFDAAGVYRTFELMCWDAKGRRLYGRDDERLMFRVHVFDGSIYIWTGEEWRMSPVYVWDAVKWNLAGEVYVGTKTGKDSYTGGKYPELSWGEVARLRRR